MVVMVEEEEEEKEEKEGRRRKNSRSQWHSPIRSWVDCIKLLVSLPNLFWWLMNAHGPALADLGWAAPLTTSEWVRKKWIHTRCEEVVYVLLEWAWGSAGHIKINEHCHGVMWWSDTSHNAVLIVTARHQTISCQGWVCVTKVSICPWCNPVSIWAVITTILNKYPLVLSPCIVP